MRRPPERPGGYRIRYRDLLELVLQAGEQATALLDLRAFVQRLVAQCRELAQQLVNSAPLAIAALKEIYRTTSEMPVEEAYRYIRSGVLKHYPSVLH